jgi:hypothetical protein
MISRMDQVYSSASITIIDASGEDAHGGLPGVSNFASRFQQRVHIGNTTILELPRGEQELKTSKWATRGWTYQEGYFSPKRLIFTPSQVLFLCAAYYADESGYCLLRRDDHYLNTRDFTHFIPTFFDQNCIAESFGYREPDIVRQLMEYSKRELTYQGDSFNAFLGILNFQISTCPIPAIVHISWGLFAQERGLKDQFRIYLDWYHESPAQRRSEFPSWTWAGWGGPLRCEA